MPKVSGAMPGGFHDGGARSLREPQGPARPFLSPMQRHGERAGPHTDDLDQERRTRNHHFTCSIAKRQAATTADAPVRDISHCDLLAPMRNHGT